MNHLHRLPLAVYRKNIHTSTSNYFKAYIIMHVHKLQNVDHITFTEGEISFLIEYKRSSVQLNQVFFNGLQSIGDILVNWVLVLLLLHLVD